MNSNTEMKPCELGDWTCVDNSGLFIYNTEITGIMCEGCNEWLDMRVGVKNNKLNPYGCGCLTALRSVALRGNCVVLERKRVRQ